MAQMVAYAGTALGILYASTLSTTRHLEQPAELLLVGLNSLLVPIYLGNSMRCPLRLYPTSRLR
jgi:hypothetical protein